MFVGIGQTAVKRLGVISHYADGVLTTSDGLAACDMAIGI